MQGTAWSSIIWKTVWRPVGEKKAKRPPLVPSEKHLKIRAIMDAGRKRDANDLEQVHGFSDEDAGVIMPIATKYSSITTPSRGYSTINPWPQRGVIIIS